MFKQKSYTDGRKDVYKRQALFWGLYVCCRSIIHKNIETANGVLGKFRDINAGVYKRQDMGRAAS